MRLPRRDGLALVMELKHSKDTATIPVVLITNRKSAADVNRGLEIGAEEVLEKPINVQLLLTRLRKVIAQSGKQVKGASLTGMLAELSFAELLQTLHLSGKTARVEVRSGLQKGSVCLVDGKVLSADLGEATGEAAFYELVALQHGRFEVQIGQRPETTNLTESTEFLLLEALRRLDERRRA
jgi:DNA-binding response OmpR family regulator